MTYSPTPEQQAAIDAFNTGDDLVLEAGAGTGKTSTLKFLAAAQPMKRIVYLAYNKAIATEAQAEFPGRNVRAMTAHSLGFQWMKSEWGANTLMGRLKAPRLPAYQTAQRLGANQPVMIGQGVERRVIQPNQLARITMETVKHFCWSSDSTITARHVPQVNGVEDLGDRAVLTAAVIPMALRAWQDISNPNGSLRFEHDHYLKLFAMTDPQIDGDVIMLDEAQDANPVIASIVAAQRGKQIVAVGDACQAIYGWRGATDYLAQMDAPHRLYLSQSFRFGQPVADEANKWLGLLDAKLRLRGAPENVQTSTLGDLEYPDAVLCRSNAEAVNQLMKFHEKGQPVSLVGDGREMKSLAEAAEQLKSQGSTWHPELCAFTSWGQVQDYVEQDAAGGDLKVAVDLIDEHGAQAIIAAIERTVPERKGVITVSTAHKSKGREWDKVKVASDFREPVPDEFGDLDLPGREEMMLAYVTVTRARRVLDREGLAWVDNFVGNGIRVGRARAAQGGGRALFESARRTGNPGTVTPLEYAQANG